MAVVEAKAGDAALIAVDHRQRAAGGIGAGQGGCDHHRQPQFISDGAGGIGGFAAAGSHHGAKAVVIRHCHEAFDLAFAAFTAKGIDDWLQAERW